MTARRRGPRAAGLVLETGSLWATSSVRATSWVRATVCVLALGLGGLSGCASILRPDAADSPRIIRPDAPADYDYLVGREFELQGRIEEANQAYARAAQKDPESAYLLRKLAEMAARRSRLDEAVDYGARALALDPDSLELRIFMGTLHRFRRDPEAAEQVLRDPSGEPASENAALLLYNVHLEAGNLARAQQVAEWLVETNPESLGAAFALAQVRHRRGDRPGADAALLAALDRGVDELAVQHQRASLRRDAGDRVGEIEVYREILRGHPGHRQTRSRLAEALDAEGRADEARQVLEDLESEYGDLVATIRLGYLNLEHEEYDEAIERLDRVLRRDPRQHEISYVLGIVYRRKGDEERAIEAFERVPAGHGRFVEARTQIAGILERRGDYREALEHVEKARQHQKARPLDLYLASLRAKSGDFPGAVEFLEELLVSAPKDPEVLYSLGVLYGEAKRQVEAVSYMQQVLVQDPDHAGALNYIGYSWAEQGTRLDEAEDLIVHALEVRPEDGYITDSLGWVYYMRALPFFERGDLQQGRPLLERSIVELERAAELTGGDPVISEHLGDAYLLGGEGRRALESYEEALAQDPRESEQPELRSKTDSLRQEFGTE